MWHLRYEHEHTLHDVYVIIALVQLQHALFMRTASSCFLLYLPNVCSFLAQRSINFHPSRCCLHPIHIILSPKHTCHVSEVTNHTYVEVSALLGVSTQHQQQQGGCTQDQAVFSMGKFAGFEEGKVAW